MAIKRQYMHLCICTKMIKRRKENMKMFLFKLDLNPGVPVVVGVCQMYYYYPSVTQEGLIVTTSTYEVSD